MLTLDSPRLRFNRGYHDGAQTARERWPYRCTHFDKVWLAAFQAGYNDQRNGVYSEDSSAAWLEYQVPAAKLSRKMAKYR